ncbi:MAG: GrpB family protein [Dehalococcoidales bacterium]|nr:GrpB family protein [Dehalococcoidales bacterium]
MSKNFNEMTYEELSQLFPVILSEYNPVWKKRYLKEKVVVEQAIGSHDIVRMNHIGSTAVPGLIAKPTIDILVEIKDGTDTARLISNMQLKKYIYLEQPEKPPPHMMFIKGYTPKGFKGPAFHVHIRYSGDWDELYFRDYLIAHPEASAEYGRLKLEQKQKFEYDRDGYTDAKTDFIKRITGLARAEVRKHPI